MLPSTKPNNSKQHTTERNQVKISSQKENSNYVTYITGLFTPRNNSRTPCYDTVIIQAWGSTIAKAVEICEEVKKNIGGLHQILTTGSEKKKGEFTPSVEITLSRQELSSFDVGYQSPFSPQVYEHEGVKIPMIDCSAPVPQYWKTPKESTKKKGNSKSKNDRNKKSKQKTFVKKPKPVSKTATDFEKTYIPMLSGDSPKEIVFLIDFSQSAAKSVDLVKSCLKSLVMKTPLENDNNRICIIQYADKAVVDQPFTHEADQLISTICGMSRRSGALASTDVALKYAKHKLLGEGRPNSKNIVIVITSCKSTNSFETKTSADELKELPNTKVFCFGIGDFLNKNEAKDIANDGMSFLVPSYAEMDNIFSMMICKTEKPILVLLERGSSDIYLKSKSDEDIDFTYLEMYDEKKRDWKIVDKARSANVKKTGLASGTEYQFRAKVKFQGSGVLSEYSDIVKATTFKKEVINAHLIHSHSHQLESKCDALIEKIKKFELPSVVKNSELNILLLGLFGNGKSSLTNLMRSVIGESAIALVGSSSYHVTQEVNAYSSLFGKARIWDIFGWDDKLRNFNDGQLIDYIVDGRIQVGSEMKENGQIEIGNQTTILERIHGVIIVVSSEVMTDDEYLGKLEKINNILIKKRYEPIYVLNKMDMIDDRLANVNEVGQGISLMYNSPSVLTYKELFVKKTRINPENIYPLVCQLQKTIPIELKYLILLLNLDILRQASIFVDRYVVGNSSTINTQLRSRIFEDTDNPSMNEENRPMVSIKVKKLKGGLLNKVNLSKFQDVEELKEHLMGLLSIPEEIFILTKENDEFLNISELESFNDKETYLVATNDEVEALFYQEESSEEENSDIEEDF